jgi:hypothetical protein
MRWKSGEGMDVASHEEDNGDDVLLMLEEVGLAFRTLRRLRQSPYSPNAAQSEVSLQR